MHGEGEKKQKTKTNNETLQSRTWSLAVDVTFENHGYRNDKSAHR